MYTKYQSLLLKNCFTKEIWYTYLIINHLVLLTHNETF